MDHVAVEIGGGEALVRQSSGRHQAQWALAVGVGAHLRGPWGVVIEGLWTPYGETSAELDLTQHLVRPAALATLTFARGGSAFEAGLGPAVTITAVDWAKPALDVPLRVEPGARARLGLGIGVGSHLRIRIQAGLAWRLSGVDHDYQLGAAWAF